MENRGFEICKAGLRLLPVLVALIALTAGCGGSTAGIALLEEQPAGTDPVTHEASLGQVLSELAALEPPPDVESSLFDKLTAELERVLLENQGQRITSQAPDGEANRIMRLAPLESTDEQVRICWLAKNSGDYNMDGEVNSADLVPLARRFGQPLNDGDGDSEDQQVDGNGDGTIDIGDVTPVGLNFMRRLDGYHVFKETLPYDAVPELVGTVKRDEGYSLGRAGTLFRFTDREISPDRGYIYTVRPFGGGEEGPTSAKLALWPGSSYGMGADGNAMHKVRLERGEAFATPGELIAMFEDGVSEEQVIDTVYGRLHGRIAGRISGQQAYRIAFPPRGMGIDDVFGNHQAMPAPGYVLQYDWLMFPLEDGMQAKSVSKTHSDQHYHRQWGLDAVHAETAWDYGEGSGMLIGVVDSGINWYHEDLIGRIAGCTRIGPTAEDYFNGNFETDYDGHGTKVTGVMVMNGGNYVGGVGLASDANVYMAKAGRWGKDEGDDVWVFPHSQVADAIGELVSQGVDVINLSLGGGIYDPVIENAVNDAMSADIVVVASAGNDNDDKYMYPAHYYGVMAVGAIEESHDRWESDADSGSQYGSWVSICAPGDEIFTTDADGGYASPTGTSFAAPHVSAAIALVRKLNPGLSQDQARHLLYDTANWIPTDEDIGNLLNVGAAMEANFDPPEIDHSPASFSDTLTFEQLAYQYLFIANLGELALNWSAMFYGTTPGLNITLDQYYGTLGDGEIVQVQVSYAAPTFGGTFESTILISSNDSDEPLLEVPFQLLVTGPDAELSTDYLYMEAERDDTVYAYFDLSNTGSNTLVYEIECNGDFLDAGGPILLPWETQLELAAGQTEELWVRVDTTGLIGGNIAGNYMGVVYVHSNDPDEPTLYVQVEYDITDDTNGSHGEIDLSTIYLTVERDSVTQHSLLIENTGSTDLEWHALPMGSMIVNTDPSGTIPAGGSHAMGYEVHAGSTLGVYNEQLCIELMEFMPRQLFIDVVIEVVEPGPPQG